MAGSLQSNRYTAVAFFILASSLMNTFGIAQRIFDFAQALVGHIRGGRARMEITCVRAISPRLSHLAMLAG